MFEINNTPNLKVFFGVSKSSMMYFAEYLSEDDKSYEVKNIIRVIEQMDPSSGKILQSKIVDEAICNENPRRISKDSCDIFLITDNAQDTVYKSYKKDLEKIKLDRSGIVAPKFSIVGDK